MNILVVSAHPDDLEMSCGGSVAQWVDEGHSVTNLIMYSNVDHVEYLEASEWTLGFTSILFEYEDRPVVNNDVVAAVEELVDINNIDRIVTHWKEDWHQDHQECHKLGTILARKQPIELLYMSSYPYNLKYSEFDPNLYIPLSNKNCIDKRAAMACYQNLPSHWPQGVLNHDRWRGSWVESHQAEVFKIGNYVE